MSDTGHAHAQALARLGETNRRLTEAQRQIAAADQEVAAAAGAQAEVALAEVEQNHIRLDAIRVEGEAALGAVRMSLPAVPQVPQAAEPAGRDELEARIAAARQLAARLQATAAVATSGSIGLAKAALFLLAGFSGLGALFMALQLPLPGLFALVFSPLSLWAYLTLELRHTARPTPTTTPTEGATQHGHRP